MNLRFAIPAALWLLVSAFASAQTPTIPPPVRMGLWQSTVTTTVTGAEGTPMAQALGSGRTTVTQGCLTPESWQRDMQSMQQRQHSSECTTTNLQQDSHHFSMDMSCTSAHGFSSTTHFEMLIDDAESTHGHADMKMSGPAFPQGMSMHMTMTTKFLSSDCGNVKPGEGRVVRP